jgi:BlaI family transcriptional regulator, penicillinase repressor
MMLAPILIEADNPLIEKPFRRATSCPAHAPIFLFTTVIVSITYVFNEARIVAKRLSDAEWEVMEVLWSAGRPLTAVDIADGVPAERDWSLATVKSLLSRLLAKRAVEPRKDGRRFLYSPAIARDPYVADESRRFVGRLFGGKLSPLFAQLAEEEALDDEDIAQIEAMLRELRK